MIKKLHTRINILAADHASGIATLRHLLGNAFHFLEVSTVAEAIRALNPEIDLIVCGIHFDDSRMFDLLSYVQNHREFSRAPVVIFRDLDSELEPTFFKSLEISSRALGAAGFIDLFSLKQRIGTEAANHHFCEFIEQLVGAQDTRQEARRSA